MSEQNQQTPPEDEPDIENDLKFKLDKLFAQEKESDSV